MNVMYHKLGACIRMLFWNDVVLLSLILVIHFAWKKASR